MIRMALAALLMLSLPISAFSKSRLTSEYPPMRYPKSHALVIGVSRYGPNSQFDDLSGTHNDAVEVASVLAHRFGFQVTLLVDKEPRTLQTERVQIVRPVELISSEVIKAQLSDLREHVDKHDALLVYFAGHGFRDEAQGYLVSYSGESAEGDRFPIRDFVEQVRSCDAHHTLIVLDSCYSGISLDANSDVLAAARIDPLRPALDTSFGSGALGRVFRRPAFQIITAGASTEVVDDIARQAKRSKVFAESGRMDGGNSPFATVMLQALRGRLGDPNGTILASQLGFHIAESLVNSEEAGQVPAYDRIRGEGDMMFVPLSDIPVVDPRLVASLYLPYRLGEPYAQLRASAVNALLNRVLSGPHGERIVGDVITHVDQVLRDGEATTLEVAVSALSKLAFRYPQSPEFAKTIDPLAAFLSGTGSALAKMEAAEALVQLKHYAKESSADALSRYLDSLDSDWNVRKRTLATRLGVPVDKLQLPTAIQDELQPLKTLALPSPSVPLGERMELHSKRLVQAKWLSEDRLNPFLARHEEGKKLVLQARDLLQRKSIYKAKLCARKAMGITGADGVERPNYLPLLIPGTPEFVEAQEIFLDPPHERLAWHSPRPYGVSDPTAMAISKDGTRIALAGSQRKIHIIDTASGKEILLLDGHVRDINSLCFSIDAKHLVSASNDFSWKVWDLEIDTAESLRIIAMNREIDARVVSAHFIEDDQQIVTVGSNGIVRFWDWRSRQMISEVAVNPDRQIGVNRVEFASDARILAVSESSDRIHLFDLQAQGADERLNRRCDFELGDKRRITDMALSEDGKLLAAISSDEVIVWEGVDVVPIARVPIENGARCVSFFGTDRMIAVGRQDGAIRLVDIEKSQTIREFREHRSVIRQIHVSTKAGIVVTADSVGGVLVWDLPLNSPRHSIAGHLGTVINLDFSADGQQIASIGNQETCVLLTDLVVSREFRLNHESNVVAVRFSPDGALLATSSAGSTPKITLWDLRTRSVCRVISIPRVAEELAFTSDSTILFVRCDSAIAQYDSRDGRLIKGSFAKGLTLSIAQGAGVMATAKDKTVLLSGLSSMPSREDSVLSHDAEVTATAISADAVLVATASKDNLIRVWSTDTRQAIHELQIDDVVTSLSFSPNGQLLASCSRHEVVKLWDLKSGKLSAWLDGHDADLRSHYTEANNRIAFSPDGKLLAAPAGRGRIKIWDISFGQPVSFRSYDSIRAIAASPDGSLVATYHSNRMICVWDVVTRRCLSTFDARSELNDIAISHDGRRLAAACSDGAIRVWALGAETKLWRVLRGHFREPLKVAFEDSLQLVSGGADGQLFLWNSETSQRTARVSASSGAIRDIAISNNTARLASIDETGTLKLWDIRNLQLLGAIEAHQREAWNVSFSRNGKKLITTGYDDEIVDSTLREWNADSLTLLFTDARRRSQYYQAEFTTADRFVSAALIDKFVSVHRGDGSEEFRINLAPNDPLLSTPLGGQFVVSRINAVDPIRDDQLLLTRLPDVTDWMEQIESSEFLSLTIQDRSSDNIYTPLAMKGTAFPSDSLLSLPGNLESNRLATVEALVHNDNVFAAISLLEQVKEVPTSLRLTLSEKLLSLGLSASSQSALRVYMNRLAGKEEVRSQRKLLEVKMHILNQSRHELDDAIKDCAEAGLHPWTSLGSDLEALYQTDIELQQFTSEAMPVWRVVKTADMLLVPPVSFFDEETHEVLERHTRAEVLYKKAIERDSNCVEALQGYAQLLALMGRPEEARGMIERAIETKVDLGTSYLMHAKVLAAQYTSNRNVQSAQRNELLDQVFGALSNAIDKGRVTLADIYEPAEFDVLKQDPRFDGLVSSVATAEELYQLAWLNHREEVREEGGNLRYRSNILKSEWLNVMPGPELRNAMKNFLQVPRRYVLALDLYGQAIKTKPNFILALSFRGELLAHRKMYKQAHDDFLEMTKLNPNDPHGWFELAAIHAKLAETSSDKTREVHLENCFVALRKASDLGWKEWELAWRDTFFDCVRPDFRFKSIVGEYKGTHK